MIKTEFFMWNATYHIYQSNLPLLWQEYSDLEQKFNIDIKIVILQAYEQSNHVFSK